MAEKGFGVKEVNLIGASGTPTITSPNNLNLNAVNVAISTNASIGGNLTVTGTVGIAGTLTYEDVTNIDAIGIITARSGIDCNGDIDVSSTSVFNDDVTDTSDADYWRGEYNNRGALNHIACDPTASDPRPNLSGVEISGVSFQQA